MRTLGEIARFVDGELRGDPSVQVARVVHPALVENAEDLALVLSPNAVSLLHTGNISNAVIPAEVGELQVPTANQIIVKRPRLVLARLMQLFERPAFVQPGIHPSAVIDQTARLGTDVRIGPHCWVGPGSVLGDGTALVAHVSIGADVSV